MSGNFAAEAISTRAGKTRASAMISSTNSVVFDSEALPTELQALAARWLVLRADRKMPDRRELSLRSLESWSDHLAIINPIHYGGLRRYDFAYCGAALVGRFGCDAMRMELRDLERPVWCQLLQTLERARQAPAVGCFRVARTTGGVVTYRDLVLPLSDGGERTSQLLMASYPMV